ncbi:MAG: Asp-tRNA(Asn)/Glu-tRNA(Gln) amidotransferase subunit GatC [Acidimicrobiia bacterium]
MITRADVEHVARLARLALSEEEIERFTGQLAQILEHAVRIEALDTASVPPTHHPIPLANVMRPDEPRPGLSRDQVLAMAPAAEDGRFRVPRIVDYGDTPNPGPGGEEP